MLKIYGERKMFKFFVFLLLVYPLCLEAQKASLEKLLHDFFENNSQMKALKESKNIAELNYKKSLSSFYPQIGLNSSYAKTTDFFASLPSLETSEDTKSFYNSHIELNQILYSGGRLTNSRKIAQLGKDTAHQAYEKQKQNLILNLLKTAYSLAFLKEQKNVLLASQKYYTRLVDLNRKKLRAGNALSYEFHQSQAELYSYSSRLKTLKQKKRLSERVLKTLLEKDNLNLPRIDLPTPFLEKKIKDLLEKNKGELFLEAQKENRDFLLAKKDLESSKLQKSLALSQFFPTLMLSYKYGYSSESRDNLFDAESKDSSIGFSLRIPLFSGFSSLHERKIQHARVFSSEKLLRHKTLALGSEVKEKYENLKEASEILQENKKWMASARKSHKDAERHFRSGRINTFQMVQVQGLRERATLSYLQSLEGLYQRLMEFQVVLGYKLEEIYGGKNYEQ